MSAFRMPERPSMDVMVQAAFDVHGAERVNAAERGDLVRLVIPWEWPDPPAFPRLRLFRRIQ